MCFSQIFVITDDETPVEFILYNDDNGDASISNRKLIGKAIMQIVQDTSGPVSVYSIAHCHIADGRQCECGNRNLELVAMYGTNGK